MRKLFQHFLFFNKIFCSCKFITSLFCDVSIFLNSHLFLLQHKEVFQFLFDKFCGKVLDIFKLLGTLTREYTLNVPNCDSLKGTYMKNTLHAKELARHLYNYFLLLIFKTRRFFFTIPMPHSNNPISRPYNYQ